MEISSWSEIAVQPLLLKLSCATPNDKCLYQMHRTKNGTKKPFYRNNHLILIIFYLSHNDRKLITNYIEQVGKKKWRRDLTETRSLWEVKPPRTTGKSCLHQLKKRWRKVEDGKIYARFSYLRNNLIFSIFLKEERDWELMTSFSSELKNLGPWKRRELLIVCWIIRAADGRPGNFLYYKSGIDCFGRNCDWTLEIRMNFCKNT